MLKSFSDLEYAVKKKLTRRDRFLAKIDSVTPWPKLHELIEPHYPNVEGVGRPPIGLARMLRMYVAQHCFGLSDEGIEDAIYDSHPHFTSPYSGTNSLIAKGRTEETTDVTLYAGLRLWRGAELWLNPEIDQGFGLSNTVGMAGFPSGEAYKIGANTPYLRLPRAFVRHVIPLGGESFKTDAAANQLGGSKVENNVTLTFGKFSVTDIFDTNTYAHDPRSDFLNWSVIVAARV